VPCPHCPTTETTEQPRRTARGYRTFRCSRCRRICNERTGTPYNHRQYPTDLVLLVVLWRLRYKLRLRDLAEMLLERYCHVKFSLNETSPRRASSGRHWRLYRPDLVSYAPIVPHFRTAVAAQKA